VSDEFRQNAKNRSEQKVRKLFARHAAQPRHTRYQDLFRRAKLDCSFEAYISWVYAVSWVIFLVITGSTAVISGLQLTQLVVGVGLGIIGKYGTVKLGHQYLRWRETARRVDIDRTLPGAARYLSVLATGDLELEDMLQNVAKNDQVYGETATEVQTVLNRASLTGNFDKAIRSVARDTPSDALGPFLIKLHDHAKQGDEELQSYLQTEAQMLSHRRSQNRKRRHGLLELVAELFVILLVLPALFVIVISVLSVLTAGLNQLVMTPVGEIPLQTFLIYGGAASIIFIGVVIILTVETLKPPEQLRSFDRPEGTWDIINDSSENPASALVVWTPVAVILGSCLWMVGGISGTTATLVYSIWALPIGAVAIRRKRIDDAKDRELKEFIHAVAGHINLGRPFPKAVEYEAREIGQPPIKTEISDLAFNTQLTTHKGSVQHGALDRFGNQIGTALARQTVDLLSGALAAGSNFEEIFDALETEVGRLYQEKRSLQESMQVYIAIGWATALLIIVVVVAVNQYIIEGFTQVTAVAEADPTIAVGQRGIDQDGMKQQFYILTQATMITCGWFAGVASQDRYVALLHSGLLVLVCYTVFAGVGVI